MERGTHDGATLPNAAMSKGFYTYKPFLGQSDSRDDARHARRLTPAERQAAKATARQEQLDRRDFQVRMARAGVATFNGSRVTFHSALGRAK